MDHLLQIQIHIIKNYLLNLLQMWIYIQRNFLKCQIVAWVDSLPGVGNLPLPAESVDGCSLAHSFGVTSSAIWTLSNSSQIYISFLLFMFNIYAHILYVIFHLLFTKNVYLCQVRADFSLLEASSTTRRPRPVLPLLTALARPVHWPSPPFDDSWEGSWSTILFIAGPLNSYTSSNCLRPQLPTRLRIRVKFTINSILKSISILPFS